MEERMPRAEPSRQSILWEHYKSLKNDTIKDSYGALQECESACLGRSVC